MITVGVDLAAEPKGTAVSVIAWSDKKAKLSSVRLGVSDSELLELAAGANKIGIDCALGWPVEFVSFLQAQLSSNLDSSIYDGGLDWRRKLSYRETDRQVRQVFGRWPLSVATDRLGMTALRCSGLLARFSESGIQIDRSGAGVIVEVYPRATMQIWKFDFDGYRYSPEIRLQLLKSLKERAPWLDFEEYSQILTDSCDAFDSLMACLAARAAACGYFDAPGPEFLDVAKLEGWIALPTQPIEKLLAN